MENGLLYTFTTIAQALAGAFALLSAFVLYRIQLLNASMSFDSARMNNIWRTSEEVAHADALRIRSRYGELRRLINARMRVHQREGTAGNLGAESPVRLASFLNSVRLHHIIVIAFWAALVVTFVVMGGSVWAIPHAHEWAYDRLLAQHWMNAGVVGFLICLFLYALVIWVAMLRE